MRITIDTEKDDLDEIIRFLANVRNERDTTTELKIKIKALITK